MNLRSQMMTCVGSLLIILPTQLIPLKSSAEIVTPSVFTQQLSSQLSTEQLRQVAQEITVKVLVGRSWGSGITIRKQGDFYTVVTNQHVVRAGRDSGYQIQTPDGRIYTADIVRTASFEGNDLALLQFRSGGADYTVAALGDSSRLREGDEVFAAGFPFDSEQMGSRGFTFTTGTISLLSDKAVQGGYQIGYTNAVEKGMSGGPILNRQGEAIGINGMHAYPLWGDPYVFADGSRPSDAVREIMTRSSMGIAIATFVQLAGGFDNSVGMPAASVPVLPPAMAQPEPAPAEIPQPEQPQRSPSTLLQVQENPTLAHPGSELLW